MADRATFVFLPPQKKEPISQREHELSMSQARSHVARLIHLSRRAKDNKSHPVRKIPSKFAKDKTRSLQSSRPLLTDTPVLDLRQPNACLVVDYKLDNPGVIRLFQYLTTSLWPRHDVGSELVEQKQSFIRHWVHLTLRSGLFHGMMWTAAAFLSHDMLSASTSQEGLRQRQLTIRDVSKDIIHNGTNVEMATLWGMLALCTPEADVTLFKAIIVNPRATFVPVFPDLYNLRIHGRQPSIAEHLSVLIDIVEVKGGLDFLGDRSFAAAVQNVDLYNSTMHIRRPRLALSKLYQSLKQEYTRTNGFGHPHMAMVGHDSDDSPLSGSVSQLDLLSPSELSEDLRELMLDLQVWSRVLQLYDEDYNGSIVSKADLSAIAFCRNIFQYRVLECTTPAFDESDDTDVSKEFGSKKTVQDITVLIQITLLIFSIGVMFPITYTLTWERLICELKAKLSIRMSHLSSLHNTSSINCLLWSCFLGGLAAGHINDFRGEEWFVEALYEIERRVTEIPYTRPRHFETLEQHYKGGGKPAAKLVRSWSEVKTSCLEPILWCGSACDAAAQRLWDRVQWRFAMNSIKSELIG